MSSSDRATSPADPPSSVQHDPARELRIPLASERAEIEKVTETSARVAVRVAVEEYDALVRETLAADAIDIERVPVGVVVSEPPPIRTEGNVTIFPVLEEQLVVEKRLLLREEIRVRRTSTASTATRSIALRRETAEVARMKGAETRSSEGEHTMDQAYSTAGASFERTIVAMFDSPAEADRAVGALTDIGIPSDRIERHRQSTTETPRDGDESWWESLKRLFMPDEDVHTYREGIRRGATVVSVKVAAPDDRRAIDLLESSGAVDVDERASGWRREGWTPQAASTTEATAGPSQTASGEEAAPGASASRPATGGAREERIPVAREELRVGKREVSDGTLRVRSYVVERPVEEQVDLRHDTVTVERRPAESTGTLADATFQNREYEFEETREEAVVSKTPRVEEEVVVRTGADTETKTVSDTVRETKIDVEDERHSSNPPTQRRPD